MPDSMDLIRAAHYGRNPPDESRRPMMPTIFEKAGEAVSNVPVLGAVLGKLGEVGQMGLKAASAIPLALQGEGGQALGRLGSAAMGVPQFFGIGGEPEYLDPGQVLTEIGIPEENLGRVDIPVLGTFTGRGLMKFALSVGTDPLVWGAPGIGGVTSAGRAAARAGTMAKAPLVAGRVGSRLAAQALAGQRSLLTFFGKPIIPKALSAKVLGMGEMGVRRLAQGPFKALSRYGGLAEGKAWKSGAQTAGGGLRVEAERAATGLIDEIDEMANATGRSVDEIMEQLAEETESFVNNPALRRRMRESEAQAAKLETAAEKTRSHVERTRSAVEKDIDRDVNAVMNEAGKATLDAFKTAGRLGEMENAARAAGDTLKADAYAAAAAAVVRAAVRRESSMLNAAARMETDVLGASARTSERVLESGRRVTELATKMEQRLKTAKLVPEVDKTIREMNDLAGRLGTPDVSGIVDDIARMADDDLVSAQRIIDDAVRPGEVALGKAGDRSASLARTLVERERKRTVRLVKIANRMGETRRTVHGQRLAGPQKMMAAAAEIRLTTPPPVLAAGRAPKGTPMRTQALQWADEYKAQGWDDRTAARAAVQRLRNPDLDPEMAPLAAMYDRVLRPLIREERRRGVATSVLSDPFLNWVKRSLTPEAAAKIAENDAVGALLGSTWRKKFGARNASASRRKAAYEGMKIPEMEAKFREFYPDFKGRFWEIDPLALIRKRARQTEGSVTKAEMFRRAVEDFARPVTPEAIAQGYVPLTDVLADSGHVLHEGLLSRLGLEVDRVTPRGSTLPTSLAGAKGMALPKEVAQSLVRMSELMSNPAVPGSLMRTLQAATDSFKWLTTRIFPAFYVRNYVSDLWRNFEADIPLTAYWKAAKAMKNPDGLIDLGNGATMPARQAIDTLDASGVKFGVMRESVGAAKEVPTGFLTRAEKRIRGAAGTAEQKLHTAVGENHTRMAHFIGRLMKGDSIDDAILSIKKHLFDYRDLSPVERSVFRTIIPFYSWQRNNLPLMLEHLATKPGKLAIANHAFEALSDGDAPGSVSTSYIPEWIKRRLFFTVKGDENEETVVSGFGLPFEDLSLLDGKPEDFLSMLNPIAKVPLELATGKDFFTGRDIADNERANPLLRHLESVPGGKAFLDWLSFRPTGREGEYRADPTKLKLFELPPLAGTSRFGRTAEQFAADPTAALGRFVTGVRQQTFTPQQQAVQNLRRAMEFATAKLEKLRAEGVVYEQNERFSVRREMLPTDPRVLEARKAQRDIGILSKMIRAQNAAMPAAGMGTAIRSGGR